MSGIDWREDGIHQTTTNIRRGVLEYGFGSDLEKAVTEMIGAEAMAELHASGEAMRAASGEEKRELKAAHKARMVELATAHYDATHA